MDTTARDAIPSSPIEKALRGELARWSFRRRGWNGGSLLQVDRQMEDGTVIAGLTSRDASELFSAITSDEVFIKFLGRAVRSALLTSGARENEAAALADYVQSRAD
jgi:hypothetical protein